MNNTIYLIDKPSGITSFDVIRELRKRLGIRKMGHAGTLDPMATGLLIVATGRLTRLVDYFHQYDKEYQAGIRLGVSTDSDDLTGEVLAQRPVDATEIEASRVRSILAGMVGRVEQRPPAISAKRVGGRRLYEVNRKGVSIEAPVATVTIHNIQLDRFALPDVDVTVQCGSGTYIRSIARDLGEALGVGGAVAFLRRTRIGPYKVQDACPLNNGDLIPLRSSEILPELDAVVPDDYQLSRIQSGASVRMNGLNFVTGSRVRIFSPYMSELVAICRVTAADDRGCALQPERVFQVKS